MRTKLLFQHLVMLSLFPNMLTQVVKITKLVQLGEVVIGLSSLTDLKLQVLFLLSWCSKKNFPWETPTFFFQLSYNTTPNIF